MPKIWCSFYSKYCLVLLELFLCLYIRDSFLKLYLRYLKGSFSERGKNRRGERCCCCWFTLPMTALVFDGPAKPGVWDTMQVSHTRSRNPGTGASLLCFPRCVSKKLDRKQSGKPWRQQLNPLCHSASTKKGVLKNKEILFCLLLLFLLSVLLFVYLF